MWYQQGTAAWVKGIALTGILFACLLSDPPEASAASTANIVWNPSASTDVTGYNVYYGVQTGVYTNKTDVGNTTNASISGLLEGVTYYFAVTAYNSAGLESDFSNEMSYTPAGITNLPPTLNALSNLTISEDAGSQTVNLSGITSGSVTELQTLTVTATSSNPNLIPTPTINYTSPNATGVLSFAPVANANGTSIITVTVNDGQPLSNLLSRTFTVTVNAINDAPTLSALNNLVINEDASAQNVSLTGITAGANNEAQTLSVTATSSNPGVVPNPTITYSSPNTTGTLVLKPVANANGTATITVSVNDGQAQNNIVSRTFTVTVNPVNDAPTLSPLSNLTLIPNAGPQSVALSGISAGPTNELQSLTITAVSSNPNLVPTPVVTYSSPDSTGSLNFTPAQNVTGTSTITVTVNDAQSQNNTVSRTFTVTVNSGPSISSISDQSNLVNTVVGPLAFTISDIETPAANLSLSATSSNPLLIAPSGLVFTGASSNRFITITPLTDQSGVADVTIFVSDGLNTNSTTFEVLVQARPEAPTLVVVTNGVGKISGLKSNPLIVGQKYTLTAIAGANELFAGWSGTYNSTSAKLTFIATSNLVLSANFVPNPFLPISGAYNGLFFESDAVRQSSAGFFTVATSTRGTYSGRLQMGAKRYSFKGTFDLNGNATNTVLRLNSTSLTVRLHLGSGQETNHITGTVTDGSWSAALAGARSTFNARTKPAPLAGSYTLILPGNSSDPSVPAGDGFGTIKVSTSGLLRFAGTLSDGSRVSQGAWLSPEGKWPLYASLYSGNGSLVSWQDFTAQTSDDVHGLLSWIKNADARALYYPSGFTTELNAEGSVYHQPSTGSQKILAIGNGKAEFTGGALVNGFENAITIDGFSKLSNQSTNALSITFSLSTGTFSGKVTDPNSGLPLSIRGAVMQKQNTGNGFILDNQKSSKALISQ